MTESPKNEGAEEATGQSVEDGAEDGGMTAVNEATAQGPEEAVNTSADDDSDADAGDDTNADIGADDSADADESADFGDTAAKPPREGDRIAKLLARAGIASRREVERMITEGRVRINDELVTTPATVLTSLNGITVDGKPVRAAEATRLFAFHKPAGLLTAERDSAGRPTIYNALRNALPPGTPRLMPVGRLDLSTEGLLLLTNDGELKRALELPSTGIPRTYRARTYGEVTQAQLESLMEGIEIDEVRYGPIDANMERRTGANQWIELTLTEGKNREVRRVLEHLGLEVSRLIRTAYGMFYIEDLPRGTAVEIASGKVDQLRRELKLAPSSGSAPRGGAPRITPSQPLAGAAATKARSASPRVTRKPAPSRPDESQGRRTKPTRPGHWDDERAKMADASASPRRAGGRGPDTRGTTDSKRPDGRRPDGPQTERPRTERPRTDGPRTDGPRSATPRADSPRSDTRPNTRGSEGGRTDSRRSDGGRTDAARNDGGRYNGGRSDTPKVNTRRERSSRDELLTSRPRGAPSHSASGGDSARGAGPTGGKPYAKPGGKPYAKPSNKPYAKPGAPSGGAPSGRTPPRGGPRNGPRGGRKP